MTTQIVADDVLGKFARQQRDWFTRVEKGSLDPDAVMRVVQEIIDKAFARDMRKEGWKLLEDVPCSITSIKDLELVPFLKDGESSILGEELVVRAREEFKINYGQHDAEWLLEHQDEIPEEFRKYYLVFTGTVWGDSYGYRHVAYLNFNGERWCLHFDGLAYDFDSYDRLPRPRK